MADFKWKVLLTPAQRSALTIALHDVLSAGHPERSEYVRLLVEARDAIEDSTVEWKGDEANKETEPGILQDPYLQGADLRENSYESALERFRRRRDGE